MYKRFPTEEPIYIQRLNKDFTLGESLKIEMYDAKKPQVTSYSLYRYLSYLSLKGTLKKVKI